MHESGLEREEGVEGDSHRTRLPEPPPVQNSPEQRSDSPRPIRGKMLDKRDDV